ncbi:MaoC family dehydratase N-terminal domain-containing protein [Kribbella sp. NPDC050459]|jgi:acyl dehydratase|uniref:FAS1-like dehydratase domain-containing protein n=1 Tax=Kribbella sp. NPDC050459 TaxID=3155785 RepID=UPI0033E98DCB
MTIDATMVGRSYTAAGSYQVGREKIREFADAIGDGNPAYRGADPIAPPTFAFVIGSRALEELLGDAELGLRLDRIVHGAQKFSYTRPIKAGDEIAATATITTVRKAGPVEVIMYETALTTVDGEPIATSTSTLSHNRADT